MQNIIFVVLILFLIICVGLYLFCKWENRHFKITEYVIKDDKIKTPKTLVVLADLHNYMYGPLNDQLYSAIESLSPDYVVSAGDMIEGAMYAKGTYETVGFLKRIANNFNFIYGCGNHEWKLLKDKEKYPKTTTEFERGLQDSDGFVKPLNNDVLDLEADGLRFFGLNLEKEYFIKLGLNMTSKEHISELVGNPVENRYNILIGHNPDQFPAYASWGADLVLAGHVHGGMIATPWHRGLISPRFIPFPKYDGGLYERENTKMILSRGLGNHTIHIRIFNRAELLVVRLLPKD